MAPSKFKKITVEEGRLRDSISEILNDRDKSNSDKESDLIRFFNSEMEDLKKPESLKKPKHWVLMEVDVKTEIDPKYRLRGDEDEEDDNDEVSIKVLGRLNLEQVNELYEDIRPIMEDNNLV